MEVNPILHPKKPVLIYISSNLWKEARRKSIELDCSASELVEIGTRILLLLLKDFPSCLGDYLSIRDSALLNRISELQKRAGVIING